MICRGKQRSKMNKVCELLRESLPNENFADVAAYFAVDDPAAGYNTGAGTS